MNNIDKIYRLLQDNGIDCQRHASLKKYTTLRIGGEANLLCEPKNIDEIIFSITICKNNQFPYYILGNGSNVLALEKGYPGMMIVLSNFHNIHREGNLIHAQSGATLKQVCAFCCEESLTGLEFACGIPGSVGGAIFMNAGAYYGETKDVVKEVTYLDEDLQLKVLKNKELDFSYRHSWFTNHPGVIIEVTYSLEKGDQQKIQALMDDLMKRRREKQPLDTNNAGSTFKRPVNNYASALIQSAGLPGFSIGDASVSTKHAGFLINKGNATSDEFLQLIKEVQRRVKDTSGYDLECEIKIIK